MFEANGLSVCYGKREILNNVSFSLEQGTITALLGANGSGKTTLLKAICGLVPHGGRCRLDGCELDSLSVKEKARLVSYIPQRSSISVELTALEVVLMGFNPRLGLLQQPTKAMEEQARQTLTELGIEASRDYLTLSEGQKQLCILGRTMVSDSGLLLLDEPESALDLQNRYEMFARLRAQMEGRTVLAALHDPQLALQMADNLILLNNKEIVAVLSPKKDTLAVMEQALCTIYGKVRLHHIDGAVVMVKGSLV